MWARKALAWFGGAWLLGALGCGGDDSSAGNKDEFVSQWCAEVMTCCRDAGKPTDGQQCRAVYTLLAPPTGYDPAAGRACLDEVRARSDSCDLASASLPSCRNVFVRSGGSKQPGDECEDDSDCATPATGEAKCASAFVDGATIRQCQFQLKGSVGSAPCLGTVDGNVTIYSGSSSGIPPTGYLCHIADGLSCDSATGACESLGAVGSPCTRSQYACVPAAYCDTTGGVCRERGAVGSLCTLDEECVSSAYCDSNIECAARRAMGEACARRAECSSNECVNSKCARHDDASLTLICGSG